MLNDTQTHYVEAFIDSDMDFRHRNRKAIEQIQLDLRTIFGLAREREQRNGYQKVS